MATNPEPRVNVKPSDSTVVYLTGASCLRALWYAHRWVSPAHMWHALPQLFNANNLSDAEFRAELAKIVEGFYSTDAGSGKTAIAAIDEMATRVIKGEIPPLKVSPTKNNARCSWCDHVDICHDAAQPLRNCRTCLHSTIHDFARLDCDRNTEHPEPRTTEQQEAGCAYHMYIPELVAGEIVKSDSNGLTYRMFDGSTFVDSGKP